jgi:hypothetical protein
MLTSSAPKPPVGEQLPGRRRRRPSHRTVLRRRRWQSIPEFWGVEPQGDSAIASFSPRKQHLVVYLVGGFEDRHTRLLERLGTFRTGKGCLYIRRRDDIDIEVLRQLIHRSPRVRAGSINNAGRRLIRRPALAIRNSDGGSVGVAEEPCGARESGDGGDRR